jgi:hypothetical protein
MEDDELGICWYEEDTVTDLINWLNEREQSDA